MQGSGSSWYSILGDTAIPEHGEVLITFEVISLLETIEFGFCVESAPLGSYFGENPEGYSY